MSLLGDDPMIVSESTLATPFLALKLVNTRYGSLKI